MTLESLSLPSGYSSSPELGLTCMGGGCRKGGDFAMPGGVGIGALSLGYDRKNWFASQFFHIVAE